MAVHPDGTTITSAPIAGQPNGDVEVGADGTVYQTTTSGGMTTVSRVQFADPPSTTP